MPLLSGLSYFVKTRRESSFSGTTFQQCVYDKPTAVQTEQNQVLNPLSLTVVSKSLGGEDLSQCHRVGMLDLFPHVHEHHTLGVEQSET